MLNFMDIGQNTAFFQQRGCRAALPTRSVGRYILLSACVRNQEQGTGRTNLHHTFSPQPLQTPWGGAGEALPSQRRGSDGTAGLDPWTFTSKMQISSSGPPPLTDIHFRVHQRALET